MIKETLAHLLHDWPTQHQTNMYPYLKKSTGRLLLFSLTLMLGIPALAQDTTHLTLQQAVQMGIANSKSLKLSKAKVAEALARYDQTQDLKLPTIKASAMASEAFIPTRKFQLEGAMKEPLELPATSSVYIGTLSINEAIFAGHKMRYAQQSADLLKKIAGLNMQHNSQTILLGIVESYINLYKIDENMKIVTQNMQDVEGRLDETIKFKNQGLATENDVLRFQLQKANVQLAEIDLQNNRKVAVYTLNIMLGLPEDALISVDSASLFNSKSEAIASEQEIIHEALQSRKDLATYQYQQQLSELNIKDINADKLPTVGVGANMYYLNPNRKFIPPQNGFLAPITLGLNLGWNISNLYTTKHKVDEAQVQLQEVNTAREESEDHIRMEVDKNYHQYHQSLQRINILKTAVAQARENDRIMELKYQNQLATTTDRIDAQTMLYQSLINLELAKADAQITYYQLMQSAGNIPASVAYHLPLQTDGQENQNP